MFKRPCRIERWQPFGSARIFGVAAALALALALTMARVSVAQDYIGTAGVPGLSGLSGLSGESGVVGNPNGGNGGNGNSATPPPSPDQIDGQAAITNTAPALTINAIDTATGGIGGSGGKGGSGGLGGNGADGADTAMDQADNGGDGGQGGNGAVGGAGGAGGAGIRNTAVGALLTNNGAIAGGAGGVGGVGGDGGAGGNGGKGGDYSGSSMGNPGNGGAASLGGNAGVGGNGGVGGIGLHNTAANVTIVNNATAKISGGNGGTGGNGGNGGNGGTGGDGGDVTGYSYNDGGDGGDGANGGNAGNGGSGGKGGAGLVTNAVNTTINNSGMIRGGNGGIGGAAGTAGSLGRGGDGGAPSMMGSLGDAGQPGDDGTDDGNSGLSGDDGDGGHGMHLQAGSTTKATNIGTGQIIGGDGRNGGHGVLIDASDSTITNYGSIVGGSGAVDNNAGVGVFIAGNGNTLFNGGRIAGGTIENDPTTIMANAVTVQGADNRVVLYQGYRFDGNVVDAANGNTLVLGAPTEGAPANASRFLFSIDVDALPDDPAIAAEVQNLVLNLGQNLAMIQLTQNPDPARVAYLQLLNPDAAPVPSNAELATLLATTPGMDSLLAIPPGFQRILVPNAANPATLPAFDLSSLRTGPTGTQGANVFYDFENHEIETSLWALRGVDGTATGSDWAVRNGGGVAFFGTNAALGIIEAEIGGNLTVDATGYLFTGFLGSGGVVRGNLSMDRYAGLLISNQSANTPLSIRGSADVSNSLLLTLASPMYDAGWKVGTFYKQIEVADGADIDNIPFVDEAESRIDNSFLTKWHFGRGTGTDANILGLLVTEKKNLTYLDPYICKNPSEVGRGVADCPDTSPLKFIVHTLSEEDFGKVVSTWTHADLNAPIMDQDKMFRRLVQGRLLDQPFAGLCAPHPAGNGDKTSNHGFWASFSNTYARYDANCSAGAKASYKGPEFNLGYEYANSAGWFGGPAFRYADKKHTVDSYASKSVVDSYMFLLYGGKETRLGFGTLRVAAGASYGRHDIATKRTPYLSVALPSKAEYYKSDYDADSWQVFANLAYSISATSSLLVEPFIEGGWNQSRTSSFVEKGPDLLNLAGEASTYSYGNSVVGVNVRYQATDKVNFSAGAGWSHLYGSDTSKTNLKFVQCGGKFLNYGNKVNREELLLNASAAIGINCNVSLDFGVNAAIGKDGVQWNGFVGASARFGGR